MSGFGATMKKSKKVMSVMLLLNFLECVLSPFALILLAFAMNSDIIKWLVIALLMLIWCGTAITANIMAGLDVKARWYAALLPFIFSLPICIFLISPKYEQLWIAILVDILLNALTCVTPLLLTAARKKNKHDIGERIEGKNETV